MRQAHQWEHWSLVCLFDQKLGQRPFRPNTLDVLYGVETVVRERFCKSTKRHKQDTDPAQVLHQVLYTTRMLRIHFCHEMIKSCRWASTCRLGSDLDWVHLLVTPKYLCVGSQAGQTRT